MELDAGTLAERPVSAHRKLGMDASGLLVYARCSFVLTDSRAAGMPPKECRMQKHIATLLLTAALASALPCIAAAAASETAPVPTGDDIEDITVTGRRPEAVRQMLLDFVVEIGDPVSSQRGFARWRDEVCVGVHNVPDQRVAQYIADKISLIALDVELEPGTPGCEPNLHIVFAPDGRELATRMVDEQPGMFRPFGGTGGTTQGLAELEHFRTSDAPVRWWQVTMIVDEMGLPAIALPTTVGDASGEAMGNVPMIRGIASRLKSPLSDAIWGSIVIVDAGKLGKVSWPQLTDYIALVALAQVDPTGVAAGYDSILNLFSATNPPPEMTDMDRSYLKALYSIDTMMMPHIQRGMLANRMLREQATMKEEE
jgi:hypothetical protein